MLMLSPFIIALLVVESLIIFLGTIAFIFAIKIVKNYNSDILSDSQYSLAKNGYLVSTIIFFILAVKIPLFLFLFGLWMIFHFWFQALCVLLE